MLCAIANDLAIDTTGANTTRLVRSLQDKLIEIHSSGRQVVALIDEAHAMPLGTLEEIRLLSNLETGTEKLLQIVLFGQPELDTHLALPHMRQLRERITHGFVLAPLPPREVKDYVNFRLRAAGYRGPDLFGPEVLAIISEASEGLTRRINIFADKTLLAAYAAGTHTITADHARAAVTDTQIVVTRRESPRRIALAAAAGVAVGIAIGFALAQLVAAPFPSPAVAAFASPPAKSPPAAAASAPPGAAAGAIAVAATTTLAQPQKPAPAGPAAPPRDGAPAQAPAGDSPRSITSRMAAGREMLADASTTRFAVQLMVADAKERGYLENYLSEAGRAVQPERLFVVPAGSPEAPRLGVLFGSFDELRAANVALAALPENLKQFRPYVRSLDGVREDVRRAENR
jgi:septal ring-binding cell division protein DamX